MLYHSDMRKDKSESRTVRLWTGRDLTGFEAASLTFRPQTLQAKPMPERQKRPSERKAKMAQERMPSKP